LHIQIQFRLLIPEFTSSVFWRGKSKCATSWCLFKLIEAIWENQLFLIFWAIVVNILKEEMHFECMAQKADCSDIFPLGDISGRTWVNLKRKYC
jgi:hypothetical protein